MPNVEKQRERLISLLKELFQLDQPDLDFGFYRIMHAKAGQVTKFLEEDLLGIIRGAFGEADGARVEQAKAAYEAARKQAEEFGAPDPDAAPKVKEAKAAWDAAKDSGSNEGDVYDHLYRFFERYYDNGDFMSRRYFARETDGKAAPYAVPYDGREVYLHWANRDQYYIKTSEYLTNFTFDPTQAKEFRDKHGALFKQKPVKVHCRIVSASEGEHNNVKASEQTERYFIIHEPEPVKIETGDTGEPELVIQFQYRPDPEKTGQEGTWRKKRLGEAADKVKALLPTLDGADDYVTALMTPAPTDAEKDRTLLEKYLAQYTSRNTMDYFIHKDLGGFLRRELDFYIKNEVMRLDDIESADAPRVESYLAKVKVLRRIAQHLIDFLAQLEDFQKRLWLKKKFVVDTQYCITLDRIPEEFYPEIAASEAQRKEWVRLFAIDRITGYSEPLTVDFLKVNKGLILSTDAFGGELRDRIIASIDDLETSIPCLAINSDNFGALGLMARKYHKSIECIFSDPPYNTGLGDFLYKDRYRHSSWATMMENRLQRAKALLRDDGACWTVLDNNESHNFQKVAAAVFSEDCFVDTIGWTDVIAWEKVYSPRMDAKQFSSSIDFIHVFSGQPNWTPRHLVIEPNLEQFPFTDEEGRRYRSDPLRKWGKNSLRTDRPKLWYPITSPCGTEVWPIKPDGTEGCWRWQKSTVEERFDELDWLDKGNGLQPYLRQYADKSNWRPVETLWQYEDVGSTHESAEELKRLIPGHGFQTVKPTRLIRRALAASGDTYSTVLDPFAGTGTTAHAVIAAKREDDSDERYIVIEAGSHFDALLLQRIKKVCYSSDWKEGKPVTRDAVSHAFKILRLESYDASLNNLVVRNSPKTAHAGDDFARDYMLRYWLDFETKGSPSLLNIEWFDDPTAYKLKIKKPGTDEYVEKAVDLVETFNWLIGLHVEHLDRWRGYDAAFKREVDPELPGDTNTRLMLDGALKETDDGTWRFRKVEGYTLRTPGDHNDREKALVVWRKLTGDLEQDNLMLDEWFRKYRLSAQDTEFDVIYVNGSNNLPNLRKDEETWKVRLIEEAFHQAMWDVEG